MDCDTLISITDDLKYMGRMTFSEFKIVFFPPKEGGWEDPNEQSIRWHLFSTDPMRFLWSCSYDKLELLCQYVKEQKGGDQ